MRKGDFSAYLADKTAREDNERAENKRLRSEILALEQSARRTKEWGERVEKSKNEKTAGLKPDKGHVGAMAAKMMKRAKSTERQKERTAAEKRSLLKDAEFVGNLKLSPLPYRAETVCALSHVRVRFGEREVLSDFSLSVRRGEAVRLSGANGCGKSTVLRLLTGEIRCDAGEISRSNDLVISYLPQTLPDSPLTPARYAESLCADPALFLAILNKFDFKSELFGFPVASFSDGQKKKVALAASLSKSAHLVRVGRTAQFSGRDLPHADTGTFARISPHTALCRARRGVLQSSCDAHRRNVKIARHSRADRHGMKY